MLGTRKYKGVAIDLFQGDITSFVCDVMVNAANSALAGGGGVDGAIHQAGGPEIAKQCRDIGHCPTGEVVATTAGNLPAKQLFHTVGPIWKDGKSGEPGLLASCFRKSLLLAHDLDLKHITFPAISTGVYGYPVKEAAKASLESIRSTLDQHSLQIRRITLVLYSKDQYEIFQKQLFQTFPSA